LGNTQYLTVDLQDVDMPVRVLAPSVRVEIQRDKVDEAWRVLYGTAPIVGAVHHIDLAMGRPLVQVDFETEVTTDAYRENKARLACRRQFIEAHHLAAITSRTHTPHQCTVVAFRSARVPMILKVRAHRHRRH
jgi:hypothetical protein